jgi:D-methionine transport system ATP-binding protein
VCDAVALLEAGRVVEHGPLSELVARPGSAVAERLLPPLQRADGSAVVDVVLLDDAAERAVAGAVADGAATIAGARVETIGGRRVGRMALVPAPGADAGRIADELRGDGARTEVLAA